MHAPNHPLDSAQISKEVLEKHMHTWLGIIPGSNPSLYRLVGVEEGEDNIEVIESGADRQMAHVRAVYGKNEKVKIAQEILNIISNARVVLLNPEKRRQYDAERAARTAQESTRSSVAQAVPAFIQPAEQLPTFTPQLSRPNKATRSPLQQYAAHIGTGIALTIAGVSAALWGMSGNSKKDTANETPAVAKADDLTSPRSAPPAASGDETIVSDLEEPPVELVEEDTTHAKILEPTPPEVQEELPTPDIKPQINITPVSTASANTSPTTNGQSFVVMQQQVQPAPTIEIQQQAPKVKTEPRRGLMDLLPANEQPTQAPTPPLASPVPRAEVQQAVVIDEEKVAQYRNILRGKITAVSSAQRVAEILKWLEKESIQADPAALKAVYLLAHEEASVAKNIQEVQRIQKMIESHRHLFPEAEQIEMRKRFFIDCTKSQELKKPERASDRQVVTSELLALFDQIVDRDPESADTVLKAAKTAIGMQRDASVKADFAKKFADAESRLKEAKAYAVERAKEAEELRLALVTLQENPHEPNALKVVAMVRLSEGKIKEALDFLSRSNSPKSGVAKDTLFMLNSPVLARGTLAAALAHEWIDLSSKLKNGKKNSANRIAARLLTIAIGAKQDPLNPIDKEMEMEVLAKLSASLKRQPIDASDVAQSSWKDVTRDIDLTKAKGEWYREANGAIVMKPGINSRIILPVTVPQFGDFEASIRCKVTRTKGNNAIQVTIPLGNGTTLVVNGWPEKGGVSGLSLIDGNEADANESCVKGLAIGDSKPQLVEVSVKRKGSTGSVHLTIDGKPSVNWSGELSRLSNHPLHRINDPQAFALGGYETQVEFSNIEMTLVTGAPAQPQAGAIRQASVERVSPQENRPAVEPNRPKNVPKEAAWNPELKGWVYCPTAPLTVENTITLAKVTGGLIFYPKDDDGYRFIRENAPNKRILLPIRKAPNGMWIGPNGVIDSAKIKWMPGEPSGGHDEYFLVYNVREQGIEDIHEEPIHSIILYQAK